MPLTNPAPIVYENLRFAMEQNENESKPVVEKRGLLGPKKEQQSLVPDNEITKPINRVASYIAMIKEKRNEINGAG